MRGAQRHPAPGGWWLQHGAGLGGRAAAAIGCLRARQGVSCQEVASPRQAAEGPVKSISAGASGLPPPRALALLWPFLGGSPVSLCVGLA